MEDYSMLLKLIENLGKEQKSFPDSVTLGQAHKAIEDLTTEIRDKDYLIQLQADEIELLRRYVKKQQEKMIKLAKRLPHWVSVEEPPKDGQYVLTMDSDEDMETAKYDGEGYGDSYGCYIPNVLYWMPLPEPPQEVQE